MDEKERTLSVVIPTYNERDNLVELVPQIFQTNLNLEVIVVDDNSPDGTGQIAEELSKTYNMNVVHRSGKSGLASAVLDGFNVASGDVIGVMDADLQHPPSLLPKLFATVTNGIDIAVASRYIGNNGLKHFNSSRTIMSRGARLLARPLTSVKDPISGYFLLRRKVVEGVRLNPVGYKILLEILVKGNYSRVEEVPFTIQRRLMGESKLSHTVILNYIHHIVRIAFYKLAIRVEKIKRRIPSLEPTIAKDKLLNKQWIPIPSAAEADAFLKARGYFSAGKIDSVVQRSDGVALFRKKNEEQAVRAKLLSRYLLLIPSEAEAEAFLKEKGYLSMDKRNRIILDRKGESRPSREKLVKGRRIPIPSAAEADAFLKARGYFPAGKIDSVVQRSDGVALFRKKNEEQAVRAKLLSRYLLLIPSEAEAEAFLKEKGYFPVEKADTTAQETGGIVLLLKKES